MTREDLFLAIGMVEESRLQRSDLEATATEQKPKKTGRIFRNSEAVQRKRRNGSRRLLRHRTGIYRGNPHFIRNRKAGLRACFLIYGKPYLITTWLSLWESCQRKLTERAFLTLSAPAGHLSQRERQVRYAVYRKVYIFNIPVASTVGIWYIMCV